MNVHAMTFALWAVKQAHLTIEAIRERFGVSRATAYRLRSAYFEARLRAEPWAA